METMESTKKFLVLIHIPSSTQTMPPLVAKEMLLSQDRGTCHDAINLSILFFLKKISCLLRSLYLIISWQCIANAISVLPVQVRDMFPNPMCNAFQSNWSSISMEPKIMELEVRSWPTYHALKQKCIPLFEKTKTNKEFNCNENASHN